TEQAYAAQIHFSNLQLTQASNMLNQEFTYVVGTVSNTGNRPVRAIEVTVEFHDLVNQLVLRDTVRIFPPGTPPLSPAHERDFQLTFEHVPSGWNHQPPSIRITGLDLQ
ncbi:MAG TPA: FxLYD domain-containing protein, partial [Candidatus Acidoferrales bacterium]|nr:FxLYD domain-containing protein [Candidatus Acidoferrales bacterium]